MYHKRDVVLEGEKDSEQSPYSSTLNQPLDPPTPQETSQNENFSVTFSEKSPEQGDDR